MSTDNEFRRVGGSYPIEHGGQEVPANGCAGASVLPFERAAKRSYLDACRERGVYQQDEETRAEIAQLTSKAVLTRSTAFFFGCAQPRS